MRTQSFGSGSWCGWMVKWSCLMVTLFTVQAATTKAPNFLFIIGEGQGWSSLSVPMDDRVPESKSDLQRTPNLDRIAKEGMRFANFYAPSPRCTPSRAAYFTGKSPAALHMTFVHEGKADTGASTGTKVIAPASSTQLSTDEVTIAALLKKSGYATAHFGKWHVGRMDPSRFGYDESDGATSNDGPDHVANPNPKQAYGITDRGMDFMERQVKAGKPFYLQIAHYAGKSVLDTKPETYEAVVKRVGNRDKVRVGAAAVAEDADITIGMLLKKLDELGIADNTYVIYTTDHGAQGRSANAPLTEGKGTIMEGGMRVPLLIRGPGVKAGTFARQRTTGVDLFPTIAALAGSKVTLPTGLEGGSLVPILKNAGEGEVKRSREEFVAHFPHYDKDPQGPTSAIWLGDFKLIRVYETDTRLLFNLKLDAAERKNLAKELSDKVKELDVKLSAYLKAVNAQIPTINAQFDPSKSTDTLPGERHKKKGGEDGKAKPSKPVQKVQ